MASKSLVLASVLLMPAMLWGGLAHTQEQSELLLQPYFIAKALGSPDGFVQGYLAEEDAAPIKRQTRSESPILIRFTVVQRFKQQGCGRVQVDMRQEEVPTKALATITFIAPPVQLNVCVDGEPPNQAPDVVVATENAQRATKSYFDSVAD